ncbi:MAG TPA: sigma-70 family RNA polymerase sigma factor [Thermomicrobiaceae bacterium]|nr:sigma-70 family RNA polymerase sigma factor [Thermomicrobiaceae bacterium]
MSADEGEAIARLRRGDVDGPAALVARYQTEATRVAQLITRDRALAEDVVQSAFVRVYGRIEQFDASRPFAPWFFRMVSRDAVKAAQRASRQVPLSVCPAGSALEQVRDEAPGPEELLATLEQVDSVAAALAQLSPAERAVIVLRYYVGLTDREVALRLGSPPGTVRWRLHRARRRLSRLLRQPDCPGTDAGAQPHEESEG